MRTTKYKNVRKVNTSTLSTFQKHTCSQYQSLTRENSVKGSPKIADEFSRKVSQVISYTAKRPASTGKLKLFSTKASKSVGLFRRIKAEKIAYKSNVDAFCIPIDISSPHKLSVKEYNMNKIKSELKKNQQETKSNLKKYCANSCKHMTSIIESIRKNKSSFTNTHQRHMKNYDNTVKNKEAKPATYLASMHERHKSAITYATHLLRYNDTHKSAKHRKYATGIVGDKRDKMLKIFDIMKSCDKFIKKSLVDLKSFTHSSRKLKKDYISLSKKLGAFHDTKILKKLIMSTNRSFFKNKVCFVYGSKGKGRYLYSANNKSAIDIIKKLDSVLENNGVRTKGFN